MDHFMVPEINHFHRIITECGNIQDLPPAVVGEMVDPPVHAGQGNGGNGFQRLPGGGGSFPALSARALQKKQVKNQPQAECDPCTIHFPVI
jgi:hypothetical protein